MSQNLLSTRGPIERYPISVEMFYFYVLSVVFWCLWLCLISRRASGTFVVFVFFFSSLPAPHFFYLVISCSFLLLVLITDSSLTAMVCSSYSTSVLYFILCLCILSSVFITVQHHKTAFIYYYITFHWST